MEVRKIIEEIIKICKECSVKKAILFGSFAKGIPHKTSDIDIAIDGVPDFELLQKKIDEIETLRRIDLIDLSERCFSKEFLEDINRYGKIIFEQV